jgi:hypothetical protein
MRPQARQQASWFERVTGKEFCREVGIGPAFGTGFAKMRNIASRLGNAGLDPSEIQGPCPMDGFQGPLPWLCFLDPIALWRRNA